MVVDDDAGSGARGPKPVLSTEIARAVESAWGCELDASADLGGSTGLNVLGATDGRTVVVRVHRHHVTSARVEALQLAREAASDAGIPTARPIRTRDSERSICVDSCVIEVEEFVASEHAMDSLSRVGAAIPLLARLHDALEPIQLPSAAQHARFANYVSANEAIERTRTGAQRIRNLDASLHPIADAAEKLAHDLASAELSGDTFPDQWCHGDFWDDNVLFGGGEIVLVADFGFMGRRPRVDDIALTLYFMLWELVAAGHPDPITACASLVDAYDTGAARPLSVPERAAIPVAVARQPLWSIGVWAAELDSPDTVAAHLVGHDLALKIGSDILEALDTWTEALIQ